MTGPMPEINALVDLSCDGVDYLSRVEDFEGPTVWVAAPLGGTLEPPHVDSPLSMRWSAGVRGRYIAAARLRSTARSQGKALRLWNLILDGTPVVDQRRQYVRAGGGEAVQIEPESAVAVAGLMTDISEGGLRCRLPQTELYAGEPVTIRVRLGDEALTAEAWVLRVLPQKAPAGVDVAMTFGLSAGDADMVRRYVLQRQVLARRTASDTS
jgi:hypothetical protein